MSPYDSSQIDNFFDSQQNSGSEPPPRGWWQRFKSKFPTRQQLAHFPRVLSKTERNIVVTFSIVSILSLISIPVLAYLNFTVPSPAKGGKFTEALVGFPLHINPLLLQANDVDRDIVQLVYAGLMKYDGDGNLEPNLAQSFDVAENGLTYTFTLKPDLKWHNGQAVTAHDVVFTVVTAQNADYSSPQRLNWQGVDVEAVDDQTVVFTLRNRYAQFINFTTLGILPKHIWENVTPSNFSLSELNIKPIGSGPYKVSEITRTNEGVIREMTLNAFDDFHLGEAYISTIDLNFFESQVDAIDAYREGRVESISFVSSNTTPSNVANNQSLIQAINIPRYFAAFFNENNNEILKDDAVREALALGTNRSEIIEAVLGGNGIVAHSPLIPGIIEVTPPEQTFAFDKARAIKLLDEAGWNLENGNEFRSKNIDGESKELSINITTVSLLELPDVVEQMKLQWLELGVNVETRILGRSEIQQAIQNRDYEVIVFGQVTGIDPDPFSFWHSSQTKHPGLNIALYDNRAVDLLLEEARDTLDDATRLAKYDEFQNTLLKDIPAVFLYSPDYIYVQPGKIKNSLIGVIGIPSDRFSNVNEWYIKTKRTRKESEENADLPSELPLISSPETPSSTPPLE